MAHYNVSVSQGIHVADLITTNVEKASIFIQWEGILLTVCLILFIFALVIFKHFLEVYLEKKFGKKMEKLLVVLGIILILLVVTIIFLKGGTQLINILKTPS